MKYRLMRATKDTDEYVSVFISEIRDDGSVGSGFAKRIPVAEFQSLTPQTLRQRVNDWVRERILFVNSQKKLTELNVPQIEITA